MRHLYVGLLSILCLSFALTASAGIVGVSEGGWSVSDLCGTNAGNADQWFVCSPYTGEGAFEIEATKFSWMPGEIVLHNDGELMDANASYVFNTYFTVEKTDNAFSQATLNITFSLMNSSPLTAVLVNGSLPVEDLTIGYGKGASSFSIDLTGPNGIGAGTHMLSFVVTPTQGSLFNTMIFGAEFTGGITAVASPEPATLLLFGVGAVILPVARRFRKK
ncbi:MAG: PEP-CTERM sorting domain-containing protein [Thermoguttaceae bacterium]